MSILNFIPKSSLEIEIFNAGQNEVFYKTEYVNNKSRYITPNFLFTNGDSGINCRKSVICIKTFSNV